MGLAAALATLLVSSTVTLWAAMSAGRATTRSVRYGWLAVELVTLMAALAASASASAASANPNMSVVQLLSLRHLDALGFFGFYVVWTVVGFGVAGILIYLEYARRGRRDSFGGDLRGSLWFGYGGISRPFGGRPRPR
jgi:hypothetical protein